jgi:hypothetical protein
MSRNATAKETIDASFAGLLAELARSSKSVDRKLAEAGLDAGLVAGLDGGVDAGRGSSEGTRRGSRLRAPEASEIVEAEIVTGGMKSRRDRRGNPNRALTYEEALRLHRRVPAEVGRPLPRETSEALREVRATPAEKQSEWVPEKQPRKRVSAEAGASRQGRRGQGSKLAEAASAERSVGGARRASKAVPKENENALGSRAQSMELVHPDQRSSILSIRLTEVESTRLRERASESGISVSAYMRSCVVEADELRAQVKMALAEMRAYSVQAEPHARPLALEAGRPSPSRDWRRHFLEIAAMLLSPLLPLRRGS